MRQLKSMHHARGAALLEALVAAGLLAIGITGHMRMLSTATQEMGHAIWHKRAQNLNQNLLAQLDSLDSADQLATRPTAVSAWQRSAHEQLPGGEARMSVSQLGNLQRIELRIAWRMPAQPPQFATSFLFRARP